VTDSSTHVYDKAKWHFGGDYPDELSQVYAYVHSGFYLTWLVENDLISDFIKIDYHNEYQATLNRSISPIRLYEFADGALVSDMLSEEGNVFSIRYYENRFFSDFIDVISDHFPSDDVYGIEPNWKNYDRIKKRLNKQYAKFQGRGSWKFWKR